MVRQAIWLLFISSYVVPGPNAPKRPSLIHTTRDSSSDLEVTGMIEGLTPGVSGFVRRADLLALHQVSATLTHDTEVPGTLHISGVTFDTLANALKVEPASDLVDALCEDRYRSHFPAKFVKDHQPILVLTINRKTIAEWAAAAHQYDASPYRVMYADFRPAFKVLGHSDQAQLPDNLVRLNFTTQRRTFDPITPRGRFAEDLQVRDGFTIAKQNCLRCHFQGTSGGTKSGRDWAELATWAHEQPTYFKSYVKKPQTSEPRSHMPGNPTYDDATLQALTAYFQTFAGDAP